MREDGFSGPVPRFNFVTVNVPRRVSMLRLNRATEWAFLPDDARTAIGPRAQACRRTALALMQLI
ncbi:hypothetical protein OKW41_005907 [Paraburkholderia sp. UCT70]